MIFNHYSAKLSELDLQMAVSVPPGGNWKNIPTTIPSKRLEKIRTGYAQGKGSRSTYYGRLHPDRPAYTITTYFSRPGNGCHLHYDFDGGQHRVISQREAARLQSFPDSFRFNGSKTSIGKQIGNAVPPLLAYQIAMSIPQKGMFVDLFSGAGGLSLGFKWAGWTPIVANDVNSQFLDTYSRNVHHNTIVGDIRDSDVFNNVIDQVETHRNQFPDLPLYVLGGPPCQGFSTAGKKRSMNDERNHLFYEYNAVLKSLNPQGFVFENVLGLANMEKGKVLSLILNELNETVENVDVWKLKADEFGIPQKRTRLIIMGYGSNYPPIPIKTLTQTNQPQLFAQYHPVVSVKDAISDLPPIRSGEDGSEKEYLHDAQTNYQKFVRDMITPKKYLVSVGYQF